MEAFGMSYVERSKIHQMIYGELIAATLRILSKLNLSSNKPGQGENQVWNKNHIHNMGCQIK